MTITVSEKSATNRGSREVGIRDLRNGLSRYLAFVAEGNRVVVTDHGKPIAEIRPLEQLDWLERLTREGRISRPLAPKSDHGPALDLGFSLSDYLER